MIVDPDLRNLQNPVYIFNIPLYDRVEVLRRTDSARIQRASKCPGQSPRDAGDHVIECGGILRAADPAAVFLLIELFDTPMHTEVNRLPKSFHLSRAVRSLVFVDTDATRVSNSHASNPLSIVTKND
jgi:hypothetical protein